MKLVHLQIRNPKDDETPIESASQIFASLVPYQSVPLWKRLIFGWPAIYSFEIYLINQTVYFYITCDESKKTLIISLLSSSYPQIKIAQTTDPLKSLLKQSKKAIGEMLLSSSFYYPIKTYQDFRDVDPLSSLLGFLSKQPNHLQFLIQIVLTQASTNWQDQTTTAASKMHYDASANRYTRNPLEKIMMKKASFQGGKTAIRLFVSSSNKDIDPYPFLLNLAGTFGSFSLGEGNQLIFRKPLIFKNWLLEKIKNRSFPYLEKPSQILNAQELATLWHPPGYLLAGIKNISWGKTLKGEPPENLPTSITISAEEKVKTNFFAKTEFKNKETVFGIKTTDRRKHIYIIGKTGAGKSTLIANMAIDDIRKDRGIGIIDPHGDLSEIILDYIPKRRINDVVYLEPFDTERPFALNVLEIANNPSAGGQKDLVASGIVSIFYKLYKDSWGPRLEYILRNVILTLLEIPNTTLVDVLSLLAHNDYRKKAIKQLKDPVLKAFWEKEFAKMPDRLKAEAISPIQNKVGQFVTSKMIRNIIGKARSTVNLQEIMDNGKILILNLSQGKLGEDNASLLGAMIITQIQLAAMNRSFQKEEERRDFFLYVDEFQNFATSSFIKILSEARKYRLSLTLANQYIDQLDEAVSKAIFGNVGTLISFIVGARDAHLLTREFAQIYTENDLVSLGKHEVVLKLSIDGMTSSPFPAKTLPLPSLKNDNKEKIIRLSKEKYGRKV
ncbi:MAG: type IV secretion system DNA-binding domain-containing protein [Patescibacteria group bacterium]|nr:type IV secretion system DNA-binding domain-containing protein [Patescibacteria group bacterium]